MNWQVSSGPADTQVTGEGWNNWAEYYQAPSIWGALGQALDCCEDLGTIVKLIIRDFDDTRLRLSIRIEASNSGFTVPEEDVLIEAVQAD